MKKTYTATFTDGTVIKRKTDRTYAYAWSVKIWIEGEAWGYENAPCSKLHSSHGFSRNRALADKARANFAGWVKIVHAIRNEVAPAIELVKGAK